jgi:hypothetical protein
MSWEQWPPFGLDRASKRRQLLPALRELTSWHVANCEAYASILGARGVLDQEVDALESVPFLPVRLFKHHDLLSVKRESVVKVLKSSGTTSQLVSRVFLDRETAMAQTRALVLILQQFIGKSRLPMLIIDHPGVIQDRTAFSARGAGILGLANFGRDHTYVLGDADMALDVERLKNFVATVGDGPALLFGFTFMVWRYFIRALEGTGLRVCLPGAVLLHSGGWKKLQEEAVSNDVFKSRLQSVCGIRQVHNFYGMAEQVGSVFVECAVGHLHAPAFADVIVRDPHTWAALGVGQSGLIQVLSVLPRSYPGHSLLTEDTGTILGEDDCACGRLGKYFRVEGRLKRAELRGCGDTHAASSLRTGS